LFDRIEKTDFSERVYEFSNEDIKSIYDEATESIMKKIKEYDELHERKI